MITSQQRAIEIDPSECFLAGEWIVGAAEALKLTDIGAIPSLDNTVGVHGDFLGKFPNCLMVPRQV